MDAELQEDRPAVVAVDVRRDLDTGHGTAEQALLRQRDQLDQARVLHRHLFELELVVGETAIGGAPRGQRRLLGLLGVARVTLGDLVVVSDQVLDHGGDAKPRALQRREVVGVVHHEVDRAVAVDSLVEVEAGRGERVALRPGAGVSAHQAGAKRAGGGRASLHVDGQAGRAAVAIEKARLHDQRLALDDEALRQLTGPGRRRGGHKTTAERIEDGDVPVAAAAAHDGADRAGRGRGHRTSHDPGGTAQRPLVAGAPLRLGGTDGLVQKRCRLGGGGHGKGADSAHGDQKSLGCTHMGWNAPARTNLLPLSRVCLSWKQRLSRHESPLAANDWPRGRAACR